MLVAFDDLVLKDGSFEIFSLYVTPIVLLPLLFLTLGFVYNRNSIIPLYSFPSQLQGAHLTPLSTSG